jgi:dephospho-CoA kinase
LTSSSSFSCAIALSGGIASGKSLVAQYFEGFGVPVIDADAIARALVAPGQPALAQIVAAFGDEVLLESGALDRGKMRERIFADPIERLRLEAILHPRVRAEIQADARACTAPYCILVIPLLVECRDDYTWVDRVLIVDAPRATQIERLMRRDATTAELAERMLATQASRAQRLALANDAIDNTGTLDTLHSVVARLHRRYLTLTTSADNRQGNESARVA